MTPSASTSCSNGTSATPTTTRQPAEAPVTVTDTPVPAGPVVGIDLGGTKIFGARLEGATVVAHTKRPTPTTTSGAVVDAIVGVIGELSDRPRAVGVGTPGVVAPHGGVVLRAPNLPGFDDPIPLGALLAERIGTQVFVGNDVNVAAYGEAKSGAAHGYDDVLAVWMGTGLGAGLILGGELRVGPSGLAGELGHAVVVPGGRRCGCGGRGHVEAYIGRRALEEHARELHGSGRPTLLVELAGEQRMKSKLFRKAYDAGDEVAIELLHGGIDLLAIAIANVAVTVDVSAVVVGGGLGERLGSVATERIGAALAALRFAGTAPAVVGASLGESAGALGAGLLATAAHGR